jgi:hypothetical protein
VRTAARAEPHSLRDVSRLPARLPAVAAETPSRWDASDAAPCEISDADVRGGAPRVEALTSAVDALLAVRVDELSDGEVEAELAAVDNARKRLDARLARLVSAATSRRSRRARIAHPDDRRAGERASRQARQELAEALNWSAQQVSETSRDGGRMEQLPRASSAADRGELSTRHLRVLSFVLDQLPHDRRDALEAELVGAGRALDPREFGRVCRRRLAEVDHDAAMGLLDRQHARRKGSVFEGDDGMMVLSGRWAGLDGETVLTAVHAFRRPDGVGESRTPGQRTADAILDALRAALRAGDASAEHGVRPHVLLTIDAAMLRDGAGAGEGTWSGPIPVGELRRVLDDCGLGWIVHDLRGLPLEAGPEVRTVPAALWRALVDRDRGCIHHTCDAPANWCDVMHLDTPFRDGGRLSLETAGLGCRQHHRAYDRSALELVWNDGRPQLQPSQPSQPPLAPIGVDPRGPGGVPGHGCGETGGAGDPLAVDRRHPIGPGPRSEHEDGRRNGWARDGPDP